MTSSAQYNPELTASFELFYGVLQFSLLQVYQLDCNKCVAVNWTIHCLNLLRVSWSDFINYRVAVVQKIAIAYMYLIVIKSTFFVAIYQILLCISYCENV